jgi:hypothetical protein
LSGFCQRLSSSIEPEHYLLRSLESAVRSDNDEKIDLNAECFAKIDKGI